MSKTSITHTVAKYVTGKLPIEKELMAQLMLYTDLQCCPYFH